MGQDFGNTGGGSIGLQVGWLTKLPPAAAVHGGELAADWALWLDMPSARSAERVGTPATWHLPPQVDPTTGLPAVAYRDNTGQGIFKVGACKPMQAKGNETMRPQAWIKGTCWG